jgi:hypothetical protein
MEEELFLQAQALMASLNSMPRPQYDFLAHKRILHNLIFKSAHEYFRTARVLAP